MTRTQTLVLIGSSSFWAVVLAFVFSSRKRRDWLATWSMHHGGVGEGDSFLPDDVEPTEREKVFGLLFFFAFFMGLNAFLVWGSSSTSRNRHGYCGV